MPYPMEGSDWLLDQIKKLVPDPPPRPFTSLALLGNGWDLALGCRSSFADFREYFHTVSMEDLAGGNDVLIRIFEQVEEIAGPGWRDFEAGLADLNLPGEVAELDYPDSGDLSELDQLTADGHDYSHDFRTGLSDTFTDWIAQLPGPTLDPRPPARALVENSDGVITFNYTDTLRTVLHVDESKILPIHGEVHGSSPLYFGCAPPMKTKWRTTGSNSLSNSVREVTLDALLDGLTKNPRLELIGSFLRHCRTLRRIDSYGFAFGEADHPYVEHLIDHYCDAATVWTHYCYSPSGDVSGSDDAENFLEVMDALGFPGIPRLAAT
ncbi:AbiH family protein [Ruania zhangjianzhongii]|uniref:AbiH family protein n=1 Tax=Ruania zhangjianzhongii TaxID=2603206 RepID=UPI00143DB2FC|nr:AbiH family protein [Ruania zhangjianzhongii]